MKHTIRKILREETDPTFSEKIWKAVQDIGKALPSGIKNPLIWLIKKIFGHTPTKARLIFPKEGWETTAIEIAESLGVVTGPFKSIGEANEFFKDLKQNSIVLEELLIGSHGSPGNLLITQKGGKKIMDRVWVDPDELFKSSRGKEGKAGYWVKTGKILHESGKRYYFKTAFLEHIKPVVNSETRVYFTACHGADKLTMLKEAADYLGCECYACMGTNAFSFRCEESNYSCRPSDIPSFNFKATSDETEVMLGKKTKGYEGVKAYDKYVADFYEKLDICQKRTNLPFNWITLFG